MGSHFQAHHPKPGSPLPPLPPCLTSANRKLTVSDFSLLRRSFAHKMHINTKRSSMERALSAYFHMTFPGKSPHEGRSNPGRQTADWRRNPDGRRGPFPKTFTGVKPEHFLSPVYQISQWNSCFPPVLKWAERPWTSAAQHRAQRALDLMTRMTIEQPLWVSASHLTCQNLRWVTFTNCVHF